MNLHYLKRILSMILIFTIIVSKAPIVYANEYLSIERDGIIHYEVRDEDFNVTEQIFEYDGDVFHFIMTEDYIFSSQLTPLGVYHFAFREIGHNETTYGEFRTEELFESYTNEYVGILGHGYTISRTHIHNYSDILSALILSDVNYFAQGTIVIENVVAIEKTDIFSEYYGFEAFRAGPPYANMNELLLNDFGQLYTGRLLMSRSFLSNGRSMVARLEENRTTGHRWRFDRWVLASTAITVITVNLNLPVATVRAVGMWTLSAAGIVMAARDFNWRVWEAELNYTKRVMIDGRQQYWAGRTMRWNMLQGPAGWDRDRTRVVHDSSHWDFFDNSGLIDTGINNFLRGF